VRRALRLVVLGCLATSFLPGCHRENPYEKFIRARARGDKKAMKEAYIEILRDEIDREWWERNGADFYREY
jgi:hypothetical protein